MITDYLVDTNIMLRWARPSDPQHQLAVDAIQAVHNQGNRTVLASQIIIEFWNAATRPQQQNGFGLTPLQADALVARIESLFPVLPETSAIYLEWRKLVVTANVSGRQVHDARIAATMIAQGISHILTFNVGDFQRFAGIIAVHPSNV